MCSTSGARYAAREVVALQVASSARGALWRLVEQHDRREQAEDRQTGGCEEQDFVPVKLVTLCEAQQVGPAGLAREIEAAMGGAMGGALDYVGPVGNAACALTDLTSNRMSSCIGGRIRGCIRGCVRGRNSGLIGGRLSCRITFRVTAHEAYLRAAQAAPLRRGGCYCARLIADEALPPLMRSSRPG